MSYRIKRVAALTGINPATLRAWERRYGLVAPGRTRSGYRLYTDEDVAMLSRIKVLVDEGLTIGEAITRVRRGAEPLPADAGGPSIGEIRERLLDALLAFDRRTALDAYEPVDALPVERRVEEVLLPVMREVGHRWEHGQTGVGEEHFASAFVREKMVGIMEALDTGAARGPEGVCAGPPGEMHEFGLMAAAIHLATRGWRVLYLGANVPLDELRRVLATRTPALLCTSVVMPVSESGLCELAQGLRAAAPRQTEVVIGGRGTLGKCADVDGVRLARELGDLLRAA